MPNTLNYPRDGRRATSTVSLDFRTPVGSSRGTTVALLITNYVYTHPLLPSSLTASPINVVPRQFDDGLPTIGEELASPECDQTLSAEVCVCVCV